ncbi:MAG: SUMF1/EgtB/PvdO family nonheme iron enzyme [Tannerella sp.]|nr:SUMF1/EgtB/PvdO family nonheme iron enzyme [Tannerella sp.]
MALAACTETEETIDKGGTEQPVYGDSTLIGFNSSAASATKAPIIDGNNITNFKVSANLPQSSLPGKQTSDSGTGFNFFEGINVLRKDTNGHWTYSPVLYWPAKEDAVSFYAYSPAASVNVNGFTSGMNAATPKDNASIDYQVPTDPGPAFSGSKPGVAKLPEDFLIAYKKQALSKGDTVGLEFLHALSMATFAARNTTKDLNVTIEKVQLINLSTHGKIDLSQDFFSGDDIYWTGQGSPADYTAGIPQQADGSYAISLPPKGANAAYVSLTAPTEQVPVLPQGFNVGFTASKVLHKGEDEPVDPGILITYRASNSMQIVASPGTRAYYPFMRLYQEGYYQGEPDFSGLPRLNAFAFQMGKRYQFLFEFDGKAFPRIEFGVGSIDGYDSTQQVPTPPTLQLLGGLSGAEELSDTLLSGLAHMQVTAGMIRTNQPSYTVEVTSGGGWLSIENPVGVLGYDGDSLVYSTSRNNSGATRTGVITLYADTAKREFKVTQAPFDNGGALTHFTVSTDSITYLFDMAFIPKGLFYTGCQPTGTVTNADGALLGSSAVTLTQDYYMSTTEVTNAQYAAFLNDIHIDASGCLVSGYPVWIYTQAWGLTYKNNQWQAAVGYEDYPVINVTWAGADAYCNWLNSKISNYHFSLPTEAQWENAAICGLPYLLYNGLGNIWNDDYGWVQANSASKTHAVGTAAEGKSSWNLMDMCGNVAEWCSDWYGSSYPAPTATDPDGAPLTGSPTQRVIRGGSWGTPGANASSTYRGSLAPASYNTSTGFRVCAVADKHEATILMLSMAYDTLNKVAQTDILGPKVTTNNSGGWTALSNDSWIVGVTASGQNGENLRYSVTENPNSYNRTGYIIVSANGVLRTFSVTQTASAATLSLSAMTQTVSSSSQSVTGPVVTTNYSSWNGLSNTSWITGVTASGSNGQNLKYSVSNNPSSAGSRSGSITVSANGLSVTLSVTQQAAATTLSLSSTGQIEVSKNSNTYTGPTVTTNYSSWTASCDASWLTFTKASGTSGQAVAFKVTTNNAVGRTCVITVSANGKSIKFSVYQRGVLG